MTLPFFGLTFNTASQYRNDLFSEIHEIVFYGENYSWETVYNMPRWLRKFTYNKILKHYEQKNQNSDNNLDTQVDKLKQQIKVPDYVSKRK